MPLSRLRRARLELDVSQFLLARMAGISASRLSLIERDQLEASDHEKAALARVLGLPADQLFDDYAGANQG